MMAVAASCGNRVPRIRYLEWLLRPLLIGAGALMLLTACDSPEESSSANTPIVQTVPQATPEHSEKAAQPTKSVPAQKSVPPGETSVPPGVGFDFYVLSLSWSPSYCEAEGPSANRQQCASGRPYAFVVHGLWPQFERGYPENCQTKTPDVADNVMRSLYDIMPSGGLIRHQWRKHGSCSGLSQRDYFKVLRLAREKVVIPSDYRRLNAYRTVSPTDVEAQFSRANPSLSEEGIAVTCDRRYLREVRICLTKNLDFQTCREVDRRSCSLAKAVMPPVRGD